MQALFLSQARSADFIISADQNGAQTLASGETGTVNSGVSLTAAAGAAAVTFTGSATLNNAGSIRQSGDTAGSRAILANTAGSTVTVNNLAGGLMTSAGSVSDTEVIRFQQASGIYLLDNQGTIWQQGASVNGIRAVRADANYTSANNQIINGSTANRGAVIRANGNDALRLGSNFTLTNYGSIFSTGAVNTSSANGSGQYLNAIATQGYSAADGVAIDDGRSNVAIINHGSITGPRHGIDGGKPAAADSDLTALAQSAIATQADQLNVGRLSVTSTGPHGVTFDRIVNGTTTTGVKVTNPVVINEAGGTITGNNGSGVGIDGAGVVINRGVITGNYAGAGNVYRHFTTAGTVTWQGQVLSTDTSSNGDGDGVDMDGMAYVENWGTIRGTGAGGYDSGGRPNGADGIAAGGGTLINRAGAIIYGQSKGILIDDGANGTAGGDGRSIPADGIVGGAARIHNEGAITGEAKAAIGLVGNFADLLVNYGTGVITGGKDSVRVDELNGTTAAAAVQMGGGNDVLVNYGKIEGRNGLAIDMGDGDDTLKLYNGGATGVVIGAIAGGAGSDTLETGGFHVFDAGTLSGFESFIVRDGVTRFNYGLGTVTALQVDAGASLQVNGSIASVGDTILNGTFKASNVATPRTMAVGGNLTLGASSVVEMGLGAGDASDKFEVMGATTVATGARIRPLARTYVADGAQYRLVQGGVSAAPALTADADSATVRYALSVSGADLLLTATRPASMARLATGGKAGMAAALEAWGQSGGAGANGMLGALDSQANVAAFNDALQQVAPDTSGAGRQAAQLSAGTLFSAFGNRIDAARSGTAVTTERGGASGEASGRRAWVEGLGAWGKQGARADVSGYKIGAGGVAVGLETDRSASEVMGVSVGYTSARADGADRADGDGLRVKGYHLGGYLSRTGEDLTFDASLILGYNDYDSQRRIAFSGFDETARAQFSGWNLGGRFEFGLPFDLSSGWSGRWLAGARGGYLGTEGYTENGSAAAQRVQAGHASSLQSVLGVELTRQISSASRLQLRGRYVREFADAGSVKAQFSAGGPSFTADHVKANRDALQLGVSYRQVSGRGVTIGIGYDVEIKEKYLAHQVTARAAWSF